MVTIRNWEGLANIVSLYISYVFLHAHFYFIESYLHSVLHKFETTNLLKQTP